MNPPSQKVVCNFCEGLGQSNVFTEETCQVCRGSGFLSLPVLQSADKINPRHYRHFDLEPIEVIESWKLGYHLGNVVKYLARAGLKDNETLADDLKKALWYLERYIELQKKKPEKP